MERISRAKCVDFDDLINGTNYKVSDEFISRGHNLINKLCRQGTLYHKLLIL